MTNYSISKKWHWACIPNGNFFPYIEPHELWSKVVHYIGDRVPFVMHTRYSPATLDANMTWQLGNVGYLTTRVSVFDLDSGNALQDCFLWFTTQQIKPLCILAHFESMANVWWRLGSVYFVQKETLLILQTEIHQRSIKHSKKRLNPNQTNRSDLQLSC
jgi:hypothetical protein